MATNTYTAIATQTLGTAAASVTFSSIPSTYTDLVLVVQTKQSVASSYSGIQFNSDTGTNYSNTLLYGNGSSAGSVRGSNNPKIYPLFNTYESTSNWMISTINIMNYANTSINKTVILRANDSSQVTQAVVGTWRNTGAITSITYGTQTDGGGTAGLAAGSTFSLYGIAAA